MRKIYFSTVEKKYDTSGKKYLDGSGGAAVVNIGHGVREVASALSRQARDAA